MILSVIEHQTYGFLWFLVFPLHSMRAGTRSVFLSIVSSVPGYRRHSLNVC